MASDGTPDTGDQRVVKLIHTDEIPAERVEEYIDANALPGDRVVIVDPETGDREDRWIDPEK